MRALTIAKGAETADKNLKKMKGPVQELDTTSTCPASMKVKSEPVQKSMLGKSSVVLKVVLRVTVVVLQVTWLLHANLRIKYVILFLLQSVNMLQGIV